VTEFVLILAALVLGILPVAFGADAINGLSATAILILLAVAIRRLILWKHYRTERNDRGHDDHV
jgi:hypothetical protein